MKNFVAVLALFAAFATGNADAAYQRIFQNIKLPSQAVLEHQTFTTPIVAAANTILTTNAGPTSAAVATVTSFTAQPDVPRALSVTPTGTTADVESCVVTISGTNIYGRAITDTFTFSADASTVQNGTKAFKTVTSASWAANCESGGFAATWTIGVRDLLGMDHCVDNAGAYAWSVFNGAFETTRGSMTADADEVEKNLFDPNGTLDGAKNVELYYVQNFRCIN